MFAALPLIVQGIEAAISAAPGVIDVVNKAKDFIASLFGAGLITKEQQDTLHTHVDAVCAALLAGQVPPEFVVDADPGTIVTLPIPPGTPTPAAASVAASAVAATPVVQSLADIHASLDTEPTSGQVMARVIRLEQLVSHLSGSSLEELTSSPAKAQNPS